MPEPTRISNYWRVMLSLPKNEEKGRKWAHNVSFGVVAETCQTAITLAMSDHPDGTLHSIHNHGQVNFMEGK